MKRSPRTEHKLVLRKDTVRMLSKLDLSEVIAGQPTTTAQPTRVECTALTC